MTKYGEILISTEEIKKRVKELGAQISKDYVGKDLFIIGVLKGCIFFLTDLAMEITVPLEMDFMAVSSYGSSTRTSGVVRILKDLKHDIKGKDVLIIEDIIDSGLTLHYLSENLKLRGPNSLRIATCLDKPERREVDVNVDYVGFEIPDKFVIGYGLDYDEKYRNLSYICTINPDLVND